MTTPAPPEPAAPPAPHRLSVKTPNVLLLAHRAPYPPDRGDRIRSYHLVRALSQPFDLAIAATTTEPAALQFHHVLSESASRVAIEPIGPLGSKLRGGLALLSGKAITPACFYRPALAQTILQWHQARPFDAVLTFCSGMIDYTRLLQRATNPPKTHVLDLVDVDSAKWASYAADSRFPMNLVYRTEAKRLRRIEAGNVTPFDHVTVVNERERQIYRQAVGENEKLHVVGNGVDLEYFQPLPDSDSKTLTFVGVLDYKPNADAVVWFAQQVMPLLRQRLPETRFQIVGRHPTARVLDLNQCGGVEVIGSVPDVRQYLAGASAIVTPLRIARGVQNKVLEAMACSRVVVASPQAAEGIDAENGRHLLIADEPDQWAARLEHVMTDATLRQQIAAAARLQVEKQYNWANQLQPMIELLRGQ
jgi:sugar transferase (PEP-CTERM/EpsH1 system associated)